MAMTMSVERGSLFINNIIKRDKYLYKKAKINYSSHSLTLTKCFFGALTGTKLRIALFSLVNSGPQEPQLNHITTKLSGPNSINSQRNKHALFA